MFEKLVLLFLFVFVTIIILFLNSRAMNAKVYTILALGDSYTIGEGVTLQQSFPYQTVQLLRQAGYNFNAPEILAVTGWTTEDLQHAIRKTVFQQTYNFVTLLIGVNDQYQQKDLAAYEKNLESLLQQAVRFAAGKPLNVYVLSIPDWGRTPFAGGSDRDMITRAINMFNETNEKLARKYGVRYINTMDAGKNQVMSPAWLAADGLHPSGKQYAAWAAALVAEIQKSFT